MVSELAAEKFFFKGGGVLYIRYFKLIILFSLISQNDNSFIQF